jgi:NADH-quinone oxidoreductase subunit L
MTTAPDLLVLVALLLPAASFLLIAILTPLRRSGRPAALLSMVAALAALGAALQAWRSLGEAAEPVTRLWAWLPEQNGVLASIGVVADGQSAPMLVLVTLVASLVQVYSLGYLSDEPKPALGRYYMYQSLFAFSMMGLVLAPNLLQLFVCWELVGLCSYLLIGFWYRKPSAARAAVKAFWTTKAGDVGLLIGIVLLFRLTHTFDLANLRAMAASGQIPVDGLAIITFCMYLGAMGKSAQFPLHIWLPDAMEGPTPVSALIHAATMVTAGVYLLTRTAFLFALTPDVLMIVAWIGAVTALMAAILACVQTDIKRVLAYSTVSQLGYMMTAIGAGYAAAGFFHLLTHGVFKALLFLGAGAVIHAVGSNEVTHMGGLARRMPQTAIVFLIGTLSLAGIPLFAGFLSKEEILGAVWAGGHVGPFLMLLAGAFLTAFYMIRVVILAFFGQVGAPVPVHAGDGHQAHGHGPAHDPPAVMALPLWVLAGLSMVIGVYFMLHHVEPEFESPAWLTPAAVGMATAGILLAWATYQRRIVSENALARLFAPIRYAAHRGFWVDDVFLLVYRAGVLGFSRLVGWTDRYIVDGLVNVVSAWTVMGGGRLRHVQTGRVQDYAFGVVLGVLVLLWWLGGVQ